MAIPISNYVDITSGVGGASAVRLRDYILRIFTENPLLPTGATVEYPSATAVGDVFGTTSTEYKMASFYFGWVSKLLTKASAISFARWNEDATPPIIYGGRSGSQATFNAVSDGAFKLQINDVIITVTGLDFRPSCSPVTLADVASIIQSAIRGNGGSVGSVFTSATVTYDATRGGFIFTGGATGVYTISVSAHNTGTNILSSTYLSWGSEAIFSNGAAATTALDTVIASAEDTDNFGSFAFIPSLSLDEITSIAEWNSTQDYKYFYCVPANSADFQTYYDALNAIKGTAVTEVGIANQYHEIIPGLTLAATPYNRTGSSQNYMFNSFAVTPTVTTAAAAAARDALRINYYGQTQTGGQNISFYQRGVLMGGTTDATDMNTYANEIWLKDSAATDILNLLLALPGVSANAQGRNEILGALQNTINLALNNGVISVGKTLNTTQKLYINNITGTTTAWQQIQTTGYWLDAVIESYVTVDSRTEYRATYILVYSKDDMIRKVVGTHTLI